MNIYGDYEPTLFAIMDEMMQRLQQINHDYEAVQNLRLFEHLNGRIKSQNSMIDKCRRKGYPINPYSALRLNHDSIGLRLVCNFIDDIHTWLDLFAQMPDVTIVEKKDYITHSKPNGYRSYHLILDKTIAKPDIDGHLPGHFFIEVQLRTIAMDTWASLEHEIKYKHHIKNPVTISQELKRVADELASCDVSMQTIRQLVKGGQKA